MVMQTKEKMLINISLIIRKSIFRKTQKELRKFTRENNIKLLRLLEYLREGKVKNEKQNRLVQSHLESGVGLQK